MHDLLCEAIPELRSGMWRLERCDVSEERVHHRNRLVFCRLHYSHAGWGQTQSADILIKICGRRFDTAEFKSSQLLWDAGFCPPSRFQVPRVYGYSVKYKALVEAQVWGESWASLLPGEGKALDLASERAATWLVSLQRQPPLPSAAADDSAVSDVRRWVQELSQVFRDQEWRLMAVAEEIEYRLARDCSPLVLSHGDYHLGNIVLNAKTTIALDLDSFGRRRASFDVGSSMGQALTMSYFRLGRLGPGARAALAFWERCAQDLRLDWSDVATQVARMLLKNLHYTLYPRRDENWELYYLWLDLIRSWLESDSKVLLQHLAEASGSFPKVR